MKKPSGGGTTRSGVISEWLVSFALTITIALFGQSTPALAFDETGKGWDSCHPQCHAGTFDADGPHGTYSSFTDRCGVCHTIHDSTGSYKLLPANTLVDTCFTCHDGTSAEGIYGAIVAGGSTVGGGHRISTTFTIPGGDRLTGGETTRTFSEVDTNYLICSDCHSPHDTDTVNDFWGERARTVNMYAYESDRLLRRKPTGAEYPVDEYGSDWCLGCHEGRYAGGAVHNHPVETSATAGGAPYTVSNLPVVVWDYHPTWNPTPEPTRTTEMSYLTLISYLEFDGYSLAYNRGFLMPYPRSAHQAGHGPICQQCHEDSRAVGSLSATGLATVETGIIDRENIVPGPDNPPFQNFPHETVNARMVVEDGDDLCLNCHPTGALP